MLHMIVRRFHKDCEMTMDSSRSVFFDHAVPLSGHVARRLLICFVVSLTIALFEILQHCHAQHHSHIHLSPDL